MDVEFIKQCRSKYNIYQTSNKCKKYRSYLINGEIPSKGITILESYQAIDNPHIKIVFAENGVKNPQNGSLSIRGNSGEICSLNWKHVSREKSEV